MKLQNRLAIAIVILGLCLVFSSQLTLLGQNLLTSIQPIAASNGVSLTQTGGALDVNLKTSALTNQSVNLAQWNGAAVASPDANNYVLFADSATATQAAGVSTCYLTSAAATNATNCKNGAGSVYWVHVTNTATTTYYLRMYNTSAAPTCSSATGFIETIPALGAPSASANGAVNGRTNAPPQAYGTGISFCFTGGGSSTDNTNAATGSYITIGYK